jgi:hypothetical protein
MKRQIILAIIVLGLFLLGLYPLAHAQEHLHGGKRIDAEVGKFYSSWMRPDARSQSCCNRLDCDSTEARMDKGHWRAFSRLQIAGLTSRLPR